MHVLHHEHIGAVGWAPGLVGLAWGGSAATATGLCQGTQPVCDPWNVDGGSLAPTFLALCIPAELALHGHWTLPRFMA